MLCKPGGERMMEAVGLVDRPGRMVSARRARPPAADRSPPARVRSSGAGVRQTRSEGSSP